MKAGDKIVFKLHYKFSSNGHRPWYRVKSFHYYFNDNSSRRFFFGGDTFEILRIVESLAERYGLDYQEIEHFDDVHKREFEFMKAE